MKRFFLSILWIAAASLQMQAQITETATQAVKSMGLGWNLGNTLDAHNSSGTDITATSYWGQQGLQSETCWGQPITKPELFSMMKKAGIGAIRVPVTWYNHLDAQGNVDVAWMARVHEVVDYVINSGLYCILNVHHDTGADNDKHVSWIKADEKHYDKVKSKYEGLWTQIANEFKDYGNQLLFEGYNEMLDTYNSWCYASFATQSQYNLQVATSAYNGINNYAQCFVNAVRATGGNNSKRNLIVNTYAAACGTGSWSSHLREPLQKMVLPNDPSGTGHIIFQVHAYPAIANENGTSRPISTIKQEVDDMMSLLTNQLASKGAPVIIGEWGTSNVDKAGKTDYDVRRDLYLQFADYFVRKAKNAGIGTFLWMGLSDADSRSHLVFSQPDLAECIAKAYHGADFVGEYPELGNLSEIVVFEGDKKIGWGDGINIGATVLNGFSDDVKLVLSYSQEGSSDDIQFYYGDWSVKTPFKVGSTSYSGDFGPGSYYHTPVGTEHQTVFTFSSATLSKLKQLGLIIHGNNIRIKKAVLTTSATGIEDVHTDANNTLPCYNIYGQRIAKPTRGLFIQGGKRYLLR